MSPSRAARLAGAEKAAAAIASATGRRAKAFTADVTQLDDVERMVAEVEAALGPVDILINSAGVNVRGQVDAALGGRLGHGDRHQPQGHVPVRARRSAPAW